MSETQFETSFPRSGIRIVLLEGIHPVAIELLEAQGFRVTTAPGALTGADLGAAVRDAHVIGIRSKTRLDEAVLAEGGRLLAVGCFCIGTNQIALDAARASGVPVFNSPFSNTRSVAELVIAEVIALNRGLADRSREMHGGQWRKTAAGAHEVRGRTLGIVGYGRIGSQVSVLAEALGMRVVFHDTRPVLALGNAQAASSLDDLLARSDVVTLHVPAGAQSDGMIGSVQLAAMRRGAFLINNARGSVVDVDALAAALGEGRLGGAAVDVFPEEPLERDGVFGSPLRGLPNVILTPHVGGSTEEAQAAIASDVATKLVRFINNGSTSGAVNVPEVELPEQPRQRVTDETGEERLQRSHRVLHFHRNVPGVLSRMHAIISDAGGNVTAEYLRTDGALGYVVLDMDPIETDSIVRSLRDIPETIRTRLLW